MTVETAQNNAAGWYWSGMKWWCVKPSPNSYLEYGQGSMAAMPESLKLRHWRQAVEHCSVQKHLDIAASSYHCA